MAAHREYFDYLHHLLDTATLPASDVPRPNLTTMAAMVAEMRATRPAAPWLNGVVLGRFLHRVLPLPLLTWHGAMHVDWPCHQCTPIASETTCYRFPEMGRARIAYELFIETKEYWSNDFDQWQGVSILEGNCFDD